MQIYDELMNGTISYQVKEDGSETQITHPPTSKDLRAARAIMHLSHQVQVLTEYSSNLQNQYNLLLELFNAKVSEEAESLGQPTDLENS